MKNIALLAALLASTTAIAADQYVNGYMRKDGTYVQPHHQTSPDRNPYNNYSTQGDMNPYTGQVGTLNPYQVQQQYSSPNSYGGGNSNQLGGNPYANPYGQQQQRRGW